MNIKKTSLLAATTLVLAVSPLFALTSTVEATTVSPVVQARCDLINSRIDLRINNFNANKETHIQRYQNIKTNVTNLVTYLKSKGYDTSKLETDLATLNTMVVTFGTDYSSFITKLEAAKQFTCGQSDGQFKAKIEEARAQLTIARTQAKDIRVFIVGTIRPDLQALRNQK